MIPEYTRPVWVEIDLDCLAYNIRQIREFVGYDVNIMGMVQGDAFGTGIPGTVDTLLEYGIDMLGVSLLDEALLIRKKRADIPVLILGFTPLEYSDLLVRYNLTQSVCCPEQAEEISSAALRLKRFARIHIKVNAGKGTGDMGFELSDRSVEAIGRVSKLPFLELEGIFSGYPVSDDLVEEVEALTRTRYRKFSDFVSRLEDSGIFFQVKHFCNSKKTLYYPLMHMDMVRVGVILFGSYPDFQRILPLKPVFSLKSKVAFVEAPEPCERGEYGALATLPLGYGDIYSRLLDGGEVLLRGKRTPVVGSIGMDRCIIDVSGVPGGCEKDDEAVIIGRQGKEEIAFENLSRRICGYVNYEFMVNINKRVPRVYKKEGTSLKVYSSLPGI